MNAACQHQPNQHQRRDPVTPNTEMLMKAATFAAAFIAGAIAVLTFDRVTR